VKEIKGIDMELSEEEQELILKHRQQKDKAIPRKEGYLKYGLYGFKGYKVSLRKIASWTRDWNLWYLEGITNEGRRKAIYDF